MKTPNIPIKHSNFTIQLQGSGFKMMADRAGRVASFWVVNDKKDIRSIFAFANSLLESFKSEGESEAKMIDDAIFIIKKYIDENKVKDLEEYTFAYENHQFIFQENANWWNKTLKKTLDKS